MCEGIIAVRPPKYATTQTLKSSPPALHSCFMVRRDQDPPATDVLLDVTVPFSGGGSPAYLEIDKLPDGRYRDALRISGARTGDLEGLLRHTRAVTVSGSFDEMVQAILDDSGR
jgi:hypothetical protein